jgi:hypothetical protein
LSPAPGTRRTFLTPAGCAVVAAILLTLGCGGGGGGSDAIPCTALSFDRALQTPANGDVYLDQSNSTCSTVDVSVVVSNLSGVFTAGFDIAYPTNLLQYSSYTLGPLMQKDGPATPPLVIAIQAGGTVQISVTRFSPDPDVDAVGSEALIALRFVRVAPGAGIIDFDTSGTSTVGEIILGPPARPASFAPGHGGIVTVP